MVVFCCYCCGGSVDVRCGRVCCFFVEVVVAVVVGVVAVDVVMAMLLLGFGWCSLLSVCFVMVVVVTGKAPALLQL